MKYIYRENLAHIGSKLSPADRQQTFLYPGARGYESGRESGTPKVKITLPSGESIIGNLKRLDDFDVSFYDSQHVLEAINWKTGEIAWSHPDTNFGATGGGGLGGPAF